MALFEDGLYSYVSAQAGVTALLGASPNTRFYPVVLPEAPTYPAATWEKVSGVRVEDHDGADLTPARLRIHVWDPNYRSAKLVAKQLLEALKSYTGTLGGVSPVAMQGANEYDLYDDEDRLHHIVVEVTIWNTEPAT